MAGALEECCCWCFAKVYNTQTTQTDFDTSIIPIAKLFSLTDYNRQLSMCRHVHAEPISITLGEATQDCCILFD